MPIRITLLGRPHVEHDGKLDGLPDERRCRLLALLALRRDWVARAELAALLWPAQRSDLAAANLRKALHFARALPWAGALESQAGRVRLVVATDVHELEAAMREGRTADALERCRGTLLDGMDDSANPAWTEWLDAERAHQARRWHELTRTRLAQLDGEPTQAAALARRLLDADPLDEDAIVALLVAQRALGRLDEQREAYRRFAMSLEEDLGIEPSLRVRRLLQTAAPRVVQSSDLQIAHGDGFFGRTRELEQLAALLSRSECRVLTVVGPGGVGKSSLLKRALRGLAPQFADGIVWIALDDLHEMAQVLARIAAELRLTPGPQQEPLPLICAHLASRRVLLAFDNGEHLDALSGMVLRLVNDTQHLKVCSTSRARLGVQGEWLLPLGGLALPAPHTAARDLLASASAQMFVACAAAVRPDFDAPAQAAAIGALVRATGGLPLAILLAADWVRLLPVADIVQELEASLDVLDSGEGEGEERPEHRSMRATFDRSWQALSTREQRALSGLSVFVGDFTRREAQQVTAAALPLLAALADKSLLQMPAGGRCSLHPLIRQFAAERLDAEARMEAMRCHARWFHGLLARLRPAAEAGDQHALDEIGSALENCRLAWRWAVAQGAVALLAGSAPTLTRYFDQRNRASEGEALLAQALPLCLAHGVAPAHAGELLSAMAHLQCRLHRLVEAAANARQGMRLARIGGNASALRQCLRSLGICCWHWGRNVEAKRIVRRLLALTEATGDAERVATARMLLAVIEKALGRYDVARGLLLEGLAHERARGSWGSAGFHLANLAALQYQLGVAQLPGADWQLARGYLDEAFALCQAHDLAHVRSYLLINLALVEYHDGSLDVAQRVGQQALEHAQAGAVGDVEVFALLHLARVALRQTRAGVARSRLGDAVVRARSLRSNRLQLACLLCLAELRATRGDYAGAASLGHYFVARTELDAIDRAMARQILAGIDLDAAVPIDDALDALMRRVLIELVPAPPAPPAPTAI